MKNNLFIKVICLIIAAFMIMPVLPGYSTYAEETIDNAYVTVKTSRDTSFFGGRYLKVEVYLNNTLVDTDTIGGFNSPGAGTVKITPKPQYEITYMGKNTSAGGNPYTEFSSGEILDIDSPPFLGSRTRTLKIYLVMPPKVLNVNYYYDNELQPDESTSEIMPIGADINLELKEIQGKVFQKAKISDDSIERSIDTVTKEISFKMPNKDVTIDYYYGTEGQVLLKKTAEPIEGKTNEFYIDIAVEGTNIVTRKSADIILVFDRSNSMNYKLNENTVGNPSRMSVLKEAADRFLQKVIPPNEISFNQVSIVTYWGEKDNYSSDAKWNDAEIIQPFSSNYTSVKNSFIDLEPETGNKGGTNMQAGFRTAKQAFEATNGAREGVEKYVIFMTDGDPTFYYNNQGLTKGDGAKFDSLAVAPTISEAQSLKNITGAKIYTVALIENEENAIKVLDPKDGNNKNIYQEENGYSKATTADGLGKIYSLLADKISDEIADKAVVTDTLPSGFTFNTENLPEGVTVDENGKLKWDLGTINTFEKKIRIETKYTGDNYGISFANESCGIEYVHKNTPDEKSVETFEVPMGVLAPIIELPVQKVPYGKSLTIDPIPSAYDINKLNVGEDKGYRISDLYVSLKTPPSHGSVVLNNDGTFTYTPGSSYEGPDSFEYAVTMWITNINPDYDPDGLLGEYVTITTVRINVDRSATYKLNIIYERESLGKFDEYTAELRPGETYSVSSPKLSGWTAVTDLIEGTMGTTDISYKVIYTRNESKLIGHCMYPNKGLDFSKMGEPKEDYQIVSDIDYTFGFKFVAGDDAPEFWIAKSNESGTHTMDNFKLYDENNYLIDSKSTLDGLNKDLVKYGKTYTITYGLRFTDGIGSVSLEVNNEHLAVESGVFKKLNITSKDMYLLQ